MQTRVHTLKKYSSLLLLIGILMNGGAVFGQIYFHNFGTTTISAHPYTVAPTTLNANLTSSSWTNSNVAWTSFGGSSGEAISLNNSGGTPTITLSFNVAAGFQASITSFDFWRQRSTQGAQNWSMTINGINVGNGTVPTSGAAIGSTAVANSISNLTGTVAVVISLSGASGTGTFRLDDFTLNGTVTPAGKVSVAPGGDWNNAATWSPVGVPTSTDNVTIAAGHTVYTTTTLTRNATTTVNGTFELRQGGFASGNNFSYNQTTGTLNFNTTSIYGVSNDHIYWPTTNGPVNVNVLRGGVGNNAAGFILNNANRVIQGNLIVNGTDLSNIGVVQLNGSSLTINGNAQINFGGAFLQSPTYGPSSTLIYNTGGVYGRSAEWNATSGAGYPNAVQISNNTTLNYPNTGGGAFSTNLVIAKNLTIDSGSSLFMGYGDNGNKSGSLTVGGDLLNNGNLGLGNATGGDLRLGGNFSSNGTFIPNNRRVFFTKNGTQTISSTNTNPLLTMPYVVLEAASGNPVVQLNCDLVISAPVGGNAIAFNSTNSANDVIDINGKKLTIGSVGTDNTIAGLGTFKGSTASTLELLGNGSLGTLRFESSGRVLHTLTLNRQDNTIGFMLGTNLTVANSLNLTNGIIDVDLFDLTIGATINEVVATSTDFIIATSGRLQKNFSNGTGVPRSFTFPVGTAIDRYSPATINFTSGDFSSGFISMNVLDVKQPDVPTVPGHYINRYWNVTGSGITSTNYSFTGTYRDDDVVGTEANMGSLRRNIPSSTWLAGSTVDTGVNTFTLTGMSTASSPITDTYHFTAGTIPVITITPTTLTGFTYVYGSGPSATQEFSVSGANVTSNVMVNAPSNYEISLNATTGFGTSISLIPSANTVTATTIFVRLKAGLAVATYNQNITATSTSAANVTLALTGTVTPRPLTVNNAVAQNKPYDGTTTASITGATLVGVISPDVVTISGGGTFASPNVGTGISVTANLTLGGAAAGNYTLTQPIGLSANITPISPAITATTINITVGGTYTLPGANVTTNSLGALTYSIASVSPAGSVTLTGGTTLNGVAIGTAQLTINQAANGNYTAGSVVVTVNVNACTPPFWEENFDYGCNSSTNIASLSTTWNAFSSTSSTFNYNPSSLSFPMYSNSSFGGSAEMTAADMDIKRDISTTSINSGAIYASFLVSLNSNTTTSTDYFVAFRNEASAYHGRIYSKKIGTNFQLGISKFDNNNVQWSTNLNFDSTYLVVIKYQFISGSNNDNFSMWIFSNNIPSSESLAGSSINANLNDTDAANIKDFVLRQDQARGLIDGIRVANSWESLFCVSVPTATTYTWTGASSSSWSNALNWSPNGIPRSVDNVTINVPGTNILNITDCRTVGDFALNGTGNFTMGSSGVLSINGNVTYGGTATASLHCNSQVFIKSSTSQTIPPLNYGNLDVLGGNRIFSPTGTIGICSGFNVNPTLYSYTVSGSTVNYFSSLTGWTMTPFTYNNLTFSGSGSFSVGNSSPAVNKTINVLGNFLQTAGSVSLGDTNSAIASLNIDGNMTISGGNFDINRISGGTGIVNLKGDLSVANMAQFTGTALGGTVNLVGTGDGSTDALTQTIDIVNTNSVYNIAFNINSGYTKLINQSLHLGTNSSFNVNNGALLDFGFANDGISPLNIVAVTFPTTRIGQTFTAQSGSTLKISSPFGITTAAASGTAGNVQTPVSGRTFNSGAIYHYIGKANQVTGNGLPNAAANKHIIVELASDNLEFTSNNGIIRFNNPSNATGTNFRGLEIRKGTVIADDNGNRFDDSATSGEVGNLKISGGVYKIFSRDIQPAVSGNYDLTAGKIVFAHTTTATTSQAIRGGSSYQYPTIEVEGKDVRYSSINVNMKSNGLFTVKENAIITNTGNSGQIVSLDDTNPASLIVKSTGIFKTEKEKGFTGAPDGINPSPSVRTNHTSGNVIVNLESGSTIEYSRSGDQTITTQSNIVQNTPDLGDDNSNYSNLKLSGSGTKSFAGTTLKVGNNLEVTGTALLPVAETQTLVVNKNISSVDANTVLNAGGNPSNVSTNTTQGILINNNGSLVQIDNSATNTGKIQMQRITQPMRRLDYTYWSSPVFEDGDGDLETSLGEFKFKDLSPTTPENRFYSWNPTATTLSGWTPVNPNLSSMIPGKGYIVRAPNEFNSTMAATYTANFVGKPNNGVVNAAILGQPDPNPITTTFTPNWNLIGNPYPSAIDAEKFLDANSDGASNNILGGTLYFWTHNTTPGNAATPYNPDDYASWNSTGGVGTGGSGDNAPSEPNTTDNTPTGKIAAGQGFFVKGLANGNALFNNAMRIAGENNQFFKPIAEVTAATQTPVKHRVWLNLTGATQGFNQTLVGYIENATNGFDNRFDGESFGGNSVTFYSILGNRNVVIQGRALPFLDTDTVPLGYRTTLTGNLTISIDHADGLLENQTIYLQDNLLNVVHNLSESAYTFASIPGTFNTRFVLRYLPQENLSNPDFDTQIKAVTVYKNASTLYVHSPYETIASVVVFDIAGRKLFDSQDIISHRFETQNFTAAEQALIVKVTLANGGVVTKKVAP